MKRHWRPGRIILAVLLFGIAALMVFFWPRHPRLRLPYDLTKDYEEILGMDGKNQLLITRYRYSSTNDERAKDEKIPENISAIRAYDLTTGQKRYSLPFHPDEAWGWEVALSPTDAIVVGNDRNEGIFQILDIPSGNQRESFKLEKPEENQLSYSKDGSYLLICTESKIRIWDIQAKKYTHQIDIPKTLISQAEIMVGISTTTVSS